MAFTEIEKSWQYEFRNNIELLLQQKDSRFSGAVTVDTYQGEGGRPVDQIRERDAIERVGRHGDTPIEETEHVIRWIEPKDYEVPADLIDNVDRLRTGISFEGAYSRNHAAALNRAKDQTILDNFFGTNKTGKYGSGTTSFDTSGMQVAASSKGMTVDKLRQARKKLRANEVDLDSESAYVGITAEQEEDLLQDIQVTSRDFGGERATLVDGKIMRFMGFNFIHSELLPVDGSSNRRCPFWVKSGVHLGMWGGPQTAMSIRADKRHSLQIYSWMTLGATRLDEEKCGEILCAE